MTIKLHYSTLDRFSESRSFTTLKGARAYATRRLGTYYDVGTSYAVSGDGVGKLEIRDGTTFDALLGHEDPHAADRAAADAADAADARDAGRDHDPDDWEVAAMMAERAGFDDIDF